MASRGPSSASTAVRASGGRYEPLRRHLAALSGNEVTLTFDEIEWLLGRALPASAGRHRAWWSKGGYRHDRAWLDTGREVDAVDQTVGWVRFRRMR